MRIHTGVNLFKGLSLNDQNAPHVLVILMDWLLWLWIGLLLLLYESVDTKSQWTLQMHHHKNKSFLHCGFVWVYWVWIFFVFFQKGDTSAPFIILVRFRNNYSNSPKRLYYNNTDIKAKHFIYVRFGFILCHGSTVGGMPWLTNRCVQGSVLGDTQNAAAMSRHDINFFKGVLNHRTVT